MSGRADTINYKCPVAIKWSSDELENIYKNGECLRSETFTVSKNSNIKYYLELYPNGDTEERKGQAWVFLALEYSNQAKIKAKFNISIESANFSLANKHDFEGNDAYGGEICSTEELFDEENGYIVNGKLVVTMEGYLWLSKIVPKNKIKKLDISDHANFLCSSLWKQENKDFTIVVGEQKITAHKWVLAAQSQVFSKMFKSGMKEAKENKMDITDFSFDVVEAAVKLCYNQNLSSSTSMDCKMKILQFFDKYEIQLLKKNLESFLISEIDESNVCRLANCSLISNALNLQEKCSDFLRACLQKTTPISDFVLLDKEYALKLLKNAFYQESK